jgi:hypothetical protein
MCQYRPNKLPAGGVPSEDYLACWDEEVFEEVSGGSESLHNLRGILVFWREGVLEDDYAGARDLGRACAR